MAIINRNRPSVYQVPRKTNNTSCTRFSSTSRGHGFRVPFSRKFGLAFSVTVLLVLLCWMTRGVKAEAKDLIPVRFSPMWLPQPQFAGYYMAREKQIYEKYGLDVTILPGCNKKNPATLLKEGKTAFATLDLIWAIQLRAQGISLINVGQLFQKSSIEFVVRKDSQIKTLSDFNTERVAVWKDRLQPQTIGFFSINNIKPTIYPVVEGIEYFLKGAVKICAVMHYNGYNALLNFGLNPEELRVFKLSELGMNFPEDGIYCMNGTLKNDPTLVKRFVEASLEGWQYALAHPEETVATFIAIRIKNHLHARHSDIKWMMSQMNTLIHPPDKTVSMGQLLKSDYDKAVSFLRQTGRIERVPAYNEFYLKIE